MKKIIPVFILVSVMAAFISCDNEIGMQTGSTETERICRLPLDDGGHIDFYSSEDGFLTAAIVTKTQSIMDDIDMPCLDLWHKYSNGDIPPDALVEAFNKSLKKQDEMYADESQEAYAENGDGFTNEQVQDTVSGFSQGQQFYHMPNWSANTFVTRIHEPICGQMKDQRGKTFLYKRNIFKDEDFWIDTSYGNEGKRASTAGKECNVIDTWVYSARGNGVRHTLKRIKDNGTPGSLTYTQFVPEGYLSRFKMYSTYDFYAKFEITEVDPGDLYHYAVKAKD